MEATSSSPTLNLASINLAANDEAARQALINLRFETESGTIAISGIDALLRILVDQIKADSLAGISTSALLSGYRGSPLGGVDIAYKRARAQLLNKSIHFLDSVNEELAATSIWGTQTSTTMPDALFDGVMGMWYGKAPGIDRAGDALRHANMSGADPKGGVICVTGDDPECKSSTIPSASEGVLADLNMPVIYPGSVQEVIDFGRFGYELSRASGLWTGMKIVTDIADAYAAVEVGPHRFELSDSKFEIDGEIFIPQRNSYLLPPIAVDIEQELYRCRLPAAKWFLKENPIHKNFGARDAQVGIVAAGKACYDVLEALDYLGLDLKELKRRGIAIHKPGVIWPLDGSALKDFARGLKRILVVEEKKDLLEKQVKDLLYSMAERPIVMSRENERGEALIPSWGHFTPDILQAPLAEFLGEQIPVKAPVKMPENELLARIPYYCSGCPHNRSTTVPEGSVAGGGIGCHTMSLFIPTRKAEGITQMGGEGAQWVGASKFVKTNHRFQNLGDGTLWHSGSLAIRHALAANTDITYKILYNDAVAMTGGQEASGNLPVPELTQMLRAEGVKEIVVVADDIQKYPRRAKWPDGVQIKERSQLDEVQKELRKLPGVSVLIYDQACAAEVRRKRKRGHIPMPEKKVFINESVCEGCGDCSSISNCLSLFGVDTPLGEKVQVHQESCNADYTCMEGNCPSFVTVKAKPRLIRKSQLKKLDTKASEPKSLPQEANIMSVGIGGTGVLTANQIIATAAYLDGKFVSAMDQTGLSQKAGTVASHLKISASPITASNRIGSGKADAILMFDVLAGVNILNKANPEKTVVVGSTSEIPTGEMIANRSLSFPDHEELQDYLKSSTKAGENFWLDAEKIAIHLFKSPHASNVILMGVAYQKGLIPAKAESIEKAFRLNGADVSTNLTAFRVGRKLVDDPEHLKKLMDQRNSQPVSFISNKRESLEEVISYRKKELAKYQDRTYAKDYEDFVSLVQEKESELSDRDAIARAVAVQLHRLMAYKDEYEVARLSISRSFKRQLTETFGKKPRMTFHLQPPSFSKLGLKNKIAMPKKVAMPVFRILTWLKPLRGTILDPFGYSKERRLERKLIEEYKELVLDLLAEASPESSNPASWEKTVEIAELASLIKGYDSVKLNNIERYRKELKTKKIELASIEKEEALVF